MPQYQGVWNLAQQAQALTSQRWATDPLFDYTTALLQADNAANGAQNNTFLDSSTNAFSITRNGGNPGATQGTFSPFSLQAGAWGVYLNGGQNIYAPSNAAFGFGTGDFTVEFWIYLTATPSSGAKYTLVDFRPTATGTPHTMYVTNSSGTLYLGFYNGTSDVTSSGQSITANTWHHCAWSRASGTLRIYVNGTQTYSAANTIDYQSTRNITIGSAVDIGESMQGYLSNFRITKGGGLYTSSFLPSTSPLTTTVSSGTVTLLTCQSNRFVDNSSSPIALSLTSTPSVQPFSPFAPQFQYTATGTGGSGYFDGTGDYLTIADNAAFDLGSGDFLIEAWAYSTNSANFRMIIGQWNSGGQGAYTLRQNAGKWAFTYTTNGTTEVALNGTSTQQLNAWAHLAVIRTGTTLSLFVNGTREATASVSGVTIFNSNGNFSVGGNGNGNDLWLGNVGPCRVIKTTLPSGYDATQTTLTVPTAPFTSTASTSILCNFTNAGILDGTLKNNWETVGTAQVNTSVVKYGSGSMSFPGTANNFIQCPGTNVQFTMGTGDWTLEAWVYPTANNTSIFDTQAVSGASACIRLRINSSNQLSFFVTSSEVTAGGLVPLNTWTHVAACKANGSLRLFVNGVQVNTTYADSNNYTCGVNRPCIGADGFATNSLNFAGYIDDLRVTKGIARYITNFTPPQVALPRQ